MEVALLDIVLPYLISAVVLGLLVAWLRSLKPLRFLAAHPWRLFWFVGFPLINVCALLTVSFVRTRHHALSPVFWPLYLSLLLAGLSLVQGIRVTWLRSRWKAAAILLAILLFPLMETFAIPREGADFYSHLFSAISIAPSLGLGAYVAHRIILRFSSPDVVVDPKKSQVEISIIDAKNGPQLYARVPPRLQAFVRDMLVYVAIAVAFLVPATLIPIQGVTQVLVVAGLLALVLYEPVFVTIAGGTIGHRSLNLRVVTASDLGPVPFPRAVVRAIVKAVLGVPVFLAVYFTAKHQGIHDLAAGTVVIPRDSSDTRNEWFAAERPREPESAVF